MTIEELKAECESCRSCEIGGQTLNEHTCTVLSNLNSAAKIMVVGQNPGFEEVLRATPFVGISGKIFDKALSENTSLTRDDLYICNAVCCFTPGNRKPTGAEFKNCSVWLRRQIKEINPIVIVTLGGVALKALTGRTKISEAHGKLIRSEIYDVDVYPILHPSPLNTNRPDKKKEFVSDMIGLQKVLESKKWQNT